MGFDIWSLIFFLVIMTPTFIWLAYPAPNDILRTDSATPILDTIASVCQVLMIAFLCVFINKERGRLKFNYKIIAVVICCLLYFASWIFYYIGETNGAVILGLTVPPCLAFLFFSLDRKNVPALIPISIFTVCHLIYGIVNFIA